jgi:hypothetical protein
MEGDIKDGGLWRAGGYLFPLSPGKSWYKTNTTSILSIPSIPSIKRYKIFHLARKGEGITEIFES